MARLRYVEQRVANRYGLEGLSLCRAVLSKRQSVEGAARLRGADSDREVFFWSRLFRKCLDVLAAAFGFAGSTQRPRAQSPAQALRDLAEDPGRHAWATELADPALRHGRP
jgi:hypothetical protein